MKQTINFSQFHDAFQSIRPDNFSYEGLRLLFDWFTDMEDCDPGCEETELDVIAICCDFNEWDIKDIDSEYGLTVDQLHEETIVIGDYENGMTTMIVFQSF